MDEGESGLSVDPKLVGQMNLSNEMIGPEYVYTIHDVFRQVNRRERKSNVGHSVDLVPGVAWVFEKAVIWTAGQDDESVDYGSRDMVSFTRGKSGFGHYVGPVLMMVPTNYVHLLYTFIAGDPRVEARRDQQDYRRKHHITTSDMRDMPHKLEKFKGSSPPKPMPKEQRAKISRALRDRHDASKGR